MRIARIVFGIRLAPAMLGAQLLLVQSVRLPAADYSAVFDRHEIEVSISKGTTTADSYQKTERGRSATIEVDAAKAASAGSGLKVSLTVEDRSPSPMLLEQCGPLNSNCTNNAKPKTLVTYSANFQRNDAALRYRGRHGFSSFSSSTGTGSDCNPDYNPWIDLPMGATKADHAAECTYSALQPRFARRADYETEESVSRQAGFSMDEGGRASYGILITIRTVYRFSRPMIRVEPQRLEMTAVARSQVPETAGFRLANSGGYLLRWRLKASYELGSWATVKPDTGDPLRPGQGIDVTVTVDPGRQNAGVTNARIEVESNGQWPYSAPDPETPVIPLKVTFVDQRDALSIASPAPPAGTKIKPDTSVSFAATVAYALASRESAGLVLRLFDQNGDALASSDPATVNRGSSQMQLTTPAIRIPGKVARLGLQALLLNPAGESILGSNTIGYEMETPVAPPEPKPANGVSLQAGEGGVWPGEPFKPPPPACALMPDREGILKSLNCIPTGRLEYTLNQSRGRIELDVTQKLRSGEVIRQRPAVHSWNVKQGERKVFWFDIRGPLLHVHDVDADIWELRARLIPSEGEIVVSEPAALPVQRVHVRPWRRSPLPSSALPIGEKPVFMNQVEYNVVLGGPLYLIGSLSYLVCGVPIHEQYWPFSSPLFAGETTRSPEPDVVVPEKEIPPNTWEVEIAYFLVPEGHRQPFGDKYGEDRIRYRRFASQATVPAGAGKTKIEPGVTLETIKNEAIKQLTAARVAQDMLGAMNSKPGGSLDPGARANTPWRAAQTAELVAVKDLLGLGATWQFDPPIAENGTFQADLKLEYDPGQFPDDPRFQESVLRIVSYDPGTGRLRSYPTTIDKQTHTATARVEGLDPYYSLAVIGPFNDAVLHAPTPDTAGVVFVNAGAQEANLRLNAYQATGQPVAGEEIENPASLRLAPGAQASSPSHAGLGKLAANAGGWIQSYSDRNTLAGTVLLARGKGFEALALDTALAASLILTGVESDSGTQAELHLTNASNFRNTVQLELRDTTGQLAGQAEIEMAPKARRESRVRNLFPQMTEPFRGRIHVQAEYRVWAALALAGADSLAAVNAQPLGPGEVTPSRLYSSHLAAGRLNIANPTAREARLSLRAFANDGSALGRAASITLRPGEQYWRDVAETFSLDAKAAVSGALVVESDAGGLAGDLSFGARAMLGLTGEAHRSVLLPHVANPAGAPMLVNIFNPSAATAAVDVRIYRADASLVGQTRVSIPPNGRISQALATLVTAAAGQVGGSIGIESDQPVVASAVLPSPDTSDVAALTAWPVLPTAKPAPVPTPAPAPTPTPAPAPPADVRIEVTPASLDFGSVQVGQTKDLSVTVRVLGNAPLTLTALSADNPRFTVLSPSVPLTVNFGATVSVQVRFAPDSAAALSATLTIRGNAPNQPVLTVRLSGTGFSTGSQELKLDDGVFEAALQPPEGASDLHMVNRLTPPAYPATLTKVKIYFHDREDGPAKGESVGILAGAATTGSDVDGTRLRATAARVGDVGRFVEYDVPPLTIESGDFVVGFNTRVERGSRPAAVDTSTQRLGLALISRDGRTFSPYGINGVFGFRAVVTVGR